MSDRASKKSCPVDHSASGTQQQHPPAADAPHGTECPVGQTQTTPSFAQSLFGGRAGPPADGAKCPVDHAGGGQDWLNPLNMMPELSQTMHTEQTAVLSTEREVSSIPRADSRTDSPKWEYPSPQQFYNALARKNMPAPEEYIDTMVDIHNFLNEGAWNEVLKWEARHKDQCLMPRLVRLQGRPRDLSPMARISGWLHGVRPFDRHDWYVDRCGKQVRYVIDYYEGVPDNDMPVFNLVVRPAIDDWTSLTDRAKQMWQDAKQKYFDSNTQAPTGN